MVFDIVAGLEIPRFYEKFRYFFKGDWKQFRSPFFDYIFDLQYQMPDPVGLDIGYDNQTGLPHSPASEALIRAARAFPTSAAMSSSEAAAILATEPKCSRSRCSVLGPTPGTALSADSI